MSEAWSQLRDIDRLSDGRVDVDFAIPLAAFPRLPVQEAGTAEPVRGQARFRREGRFAVAELDVSGDVLLICQRCLSPMVKAVQTSTQVALVRSDAEADKVPAEFEPVRAPEGRIRVRDLVEEELLLALPIVPLHENPEDCAPAALAPVADAADEAGKSMQKPFERLGELLKR